MTSKNLARPFNERALQKKRTQTWVDAMPNGKTCSMAYLTTCTRTHIKPPDYYYKDALINTRVIDDVHGYMNNLWTFIIFCGRRQKKYATYTYAGWEISPFLCHKCSRQSQTE